jgi:ABC-2 type transport system permease protein
LPAVAIGSVALTLSAGDSVLAGDWSRTVWMALAYLGYFAIFVAVSLGVSAWATSSRAALVALLAFWALNGLFAARAVADLGSFLYPTPSAVAFATELRRDLDDQTVLRERLDRRRRELLARYEVTSVAELPISFAGIELQESENYGNEVFDAHFGALFDTYERQNRLEQLAAVAAPLLGLRSLSMGLAGTDFNQHRHFTTAAEEYRRTIQVIMNDDITARAARVDGPYTAGPDLWARVPDFDYRAPGAGWVLANHALSIGMLSVWLLASVVFAVAATRRLRAE